jgi:hypothetical protein
MRTRYLRVGRRAAAILACLALAGPSRPARATPLDYLPVGDPLEAELRILDLLDPAPLGDRIRLPHLHTRPLARFEIEGAGSPADSLATSHRISLVRLERGLGRDAADRFAAAATERSTPRLLQLDRGDGTRLEISAGIEGRGDLDEHDSRFESGSGAHARIGASFDRWLAYTHLVAGHEDGARRFADPIVPGSDLIVHTEESYLAYAAPSERWGFQFGRSRWHWGPGEEGSLALSRTSAALTGLATHGRLEALRLDAVALSVTLRAAAGEQLAAHRLEWQAWPALRLGLTEMARYRAPAWQPLYLVGLLPYVLVQRLQVQDEGDSSAALRNNVLVGVDAAWRIAPGTRVYGELLIDDLHARTGRIPNKIAYQLGWEGVGLLGRTRASWGTEYTRLSRFVYTSYFGRAYEAQGLPLGFFTGPDSRRVRVRGAWDLGPAWQVLAHATQTDRGENGLGEPFVPGAPRVETLRFEGVVERTRELDLGLRWWPAGGVDLALSGGFRWIENQRHVRGAQDRGPTATLALRLTR